MVSSDFGTLRMFSITDTSNYYNHNYRKIETPFVKDIQKGKGEKVCVQTKEEKQLMVNNWSNVITEKMQDINYFTIKKCIRNTLLNKNIIRQSIRQLNLN